MPTPNRGVLTTYSPIIHMTVPYGLSADIYHEDFSFRATAGKLCGMYGNLESLFIIL